MSRHIAKRGAMPYDIRILSNDEYAQWERYLESSPHATFFHRLGWLNVVQQTYGHEPQYLIARKDNEVAGVLPLFLVPNLLLGRVLASDVFASYGGACADSPAVETALAVRASQLASLHGASYLEIKNTNNIQGLTGKWQTKTTYCTMRLDIRDGAENVWKRWRNDNRTSVRKAVKSQVDVEEGAHLLDDFFELVALEMKRLGTPVHSKTFYRNILREFGDDARLFVAKKSGRTVAAMLALLYKNQVHLQVTVSLWSYRTIQASALLYWEIIQLVCKQGYEFIDFGRSSWNSGTFKFKKHMGAEPVPLYYEYYLNRCRRVPNIDPSNKKYRLAIRLWSHLPLSITKLLGPHLIKHIV